MKKLFIALVFVATGLVANAQLFVGGSIGFSHGAGYSEETITVNGVVEPDYGDLGYKPRTTTFSIAPTVGMMFSDRMGFGATIGYKQEITKTCTDVEKKEFDDKIGLSEFDFTPFFRYVFGDFGKIKLYADAKLPLAFASSKSVYKDIEEDEEITVKEKGPKGFGIGFYIQPAFTYQFNEHISFNAELGLLSLGWYQTKLTAVEEEEILGEEIKAEYIEKDSEFGFGINGRVPVEFGFVYTF